MNDLIQAAKEGWEIVLGALAFVAGYVRLKGQSDANRENLERLEQRMTKQRDEDVARTARSLESIDKKLDRLVDHILTK